MACTRTELHEYLGNFSASLDPVNAIVCPFTQSAGSGLGLGLPLFTLLVVAPVGLAMTVRMQHPGPLVVAGMLTMGAVVGAGQLQGQAAQIAAIVLLFALTAIGFFLYQRFKRTM